MKILLHHPRLLPPKDYGGTERVVLWLARGLVERGHEVHVAARAGSVLPPGARLVECPENEAAGMEDLLGRLPKGLDLVHFQAPGAEPIAERYGAAALLTVHGNGKPGEVFPRNTVFLSGDHARRHGGREFVYNGIDPSEFEFRKKKEGWFLFLSKTSWKVKNLSGAMDLAARAKRPLRIAGGARPWGARVRAALSPGFNWEGPVANPRKKELLAGAGALVFPVLWDEPFGLVVAEALMSGTPVLGSARGSLPELITPEVGAILRGDGEWVEALRAEPRWSAEACRSRAEKLFHYSRMAEGYEKVYQKVAAGQLLHPAEPRVPRASKTEEPSR
jgi:glycosyltransferase involved in cell wall biosynthesis